MFAQIIFQKRHSAGLVSEGAVELRFEAVLEDLFEPGAGLESEGDKMASENERVRGGGLKGEGPGAFAKLRDARECLE